MAKTWVLQTETKGTGATMVPLESTQKRSAPPTPLFVPRKRQPREPAPPAPRAPRRFRIVDLMTRETLLDDAPAAEALPALTKVRSTVDVIVSVWDEGRSRWRALTLSEQQVMFDLAHQLDVTIGTRT